MTSMTLPALTSENGLSRYLQEVWKFPILEKEQEYMLAYRLRDEGDVDAAHQLVTSHLRLVAKIAMGYRGYGLPVSDLISEGNIGLMKAVKKFDPDKGFRLSTYAIWWIKASITEYVLKSWSMVKMGTVASQKKLFFSLRRMKNQLKIYDNGELSDEQVGMISEAVGATEQEVQHMNRRLHSRDLSLNAPLSQTEDGAAEFQDTLVDERPNPEALVGASEEMSVRSGMLERALAELPDRERHILIERRLKDDPVTLEELGEQYGISRERIRQLEVRAFDKVQKLVRAEALEAAAG
ncbi:MAG: RNA polymerase sigma factor RpoH [Rhodospirillales bacterium]|nr:RNA polymerase sigma factor RpoH [Rhodospirillales bacterium]MBO6788822.1 RNA polymerase sigma factor RpoH [Rhodospirillales bacterium]